MVVFDTTILIDLFNDKLQGDRKARLDHLVAGLEKQRTKILIPAPALAEFMAKAGKARDAYYQRLHQTSKFTIAPFNARAAMECALMLDAALTKGDKRSNGATWAKAKFDWQIVAIAKSENTREIYSDDGDIARIGKREGLSVISTNNLELPISARQHLIPFEED